jgi:hypothetical protein
MSKLLLQLLLDNKSIGVVSNLLLKSVLMMLTMSSPVLLLTEVSSKVPTLLLLMSPVLLHSLSLLEPKTMLRTITLVLLLDLADGVTVLVLTVSGVLLE